MKTLSALLPLVLGLAFLPPTFAADAKPAAAAPVPAQEAPAGDLLDEKNLVGILITRDGGGFLNVKVESGNFVIAFYDANKKATKPDVTTASLRYRKHGNDRRFVLKLAGDGQTMTAPKPVDRPYIFNVLHVVLLDADETTETETYTVNFKQFTAEDGASIPVDEMTPQQLQKVKQ